MAENEARPTAGREPDVLILTSILVDHRLIEACRGRGLEPLVIADPNSLPRRRFVPDDVRVLMVDDVRVPSNVLSELHRAGLAKHPFAAVLTSDDYTMVTAATIGRLLGVPALDPLVALAFCDKAVQKDIVRAAGIRTARSVVIDDLQSVDTDADADALMASFGDKAVLKPIAGSGTYDTAVISSAEELRARSRDNQESHAYTRKFLLEEFVPGDEWFADGVVFGGELLFMSLSKYCDPLLTVITEQIPLWLRRFDPGTESWAYDLARPLVSAALAALGLTDGVFHLELFHDPETGTVTFGECAARFAGAFTVEEVKVKFAVDLADAMLACALGKRPELAVSVRPGMVGNMYLPSRPGIVMSCPSRFDLEALEGVAYASIDTPVGTVIPRGIAHSSVRIGQVLLTAETEEAFVARTAEIRAWFDERLVLAPVDVSTLELWEWQRRTYPDVRIEETGFGGGGAAH